MIPRLLSTTLLSALRSSPSVVLLGPRQVGKTTLARQLSQQFPNTIFLDCEKQSDRRRLQNFELFSEDTQEHLVVLDEVQTQPDLFAQIRPAIDAHRRPGRFLLLGSASGQLLHQTAESLAGRTRYVTLSPLLLAELSQTDQPSENVRRLWLRGGYPQSLLAPDDQASFDYRQSLVQTLITRELPSLGVGAAVQTMSRLWQMLAHLHGQPLNASQLGLSIGGRSHASVGLYVDQLADAFLIRLLPAFHVNLGKRLVKSSRAYIRDAGLLHALLGIQTLSDLTGHPVAGPSWEGFVIEQVLGLLPESPGTVIGYYRTSAGAELDLVLQAPDGSRLAIEIKLSEAPKLSKGFWQAKQDLNPKQTLVICPVLQPYRLAEDVEVIPPWLIGKRLADQGFKLHLN